MRKNLNEKSQKIGKARFFLFSFNGRIFNHLFCFSLKKFLLNFLIFSFRSLSHRVETTLSANNFNFQNKRYLFNLTRLVAAQAGILHEILL